MISERTTRFTGRAFSTCSPPKSKVRGYKQISTQWTTIVSQVQQDMNSLHEAYNEWIDGMTLTYW